MQPIDHVHHESGDAAPRRPIRDDSTDLGLLVLLSTTRTVVQSNERAQALLEQLRHLQTLSDDAATTPSDLPLSIRNVCDEAHQTLSDRSEQNDWQPFEVSRLIGHANTAMMVRAFVFPSRASLTSTRILVTLQPYAPV